MKRAVLLRLALKNLAREITSRVRTECFRYSLEDTALIIKLKKHCRCSDGFSAGGL